MKSIVYKRKKLLSPKLVRSFKGLATTIVSDAMNKMNAVSAQIRPVSKKTRFAGLALTVQTMVGDNIMSHLALEEADRGDVIVIDARGHTDTAVWGFVQTSSAIRRGVQAVVIDGVIRDLDENRDSSLPLFCRGVSPAGPHKGWGGFINVPISCGGACVRPGDIILGDSDGVVVVPYYWAERILKESRQRLKLEKEWMAKLKRGSTTIEAVGLTAQVAHLKVEKKRKAYDED